MKAIIVLHSVFSALPSDVRRVCDVCDSLRPSGKRLFSLGYAPPLGRSREHCVEQSRPCTSDGEAAGAPW